MKIVTHNILSLIQSGRTQEVHLEYQRSRVHAVRLQGTRLRAHPDLLVSRSSVSGFEMFSWGYGKGKHTNRACGVSIPLSSDLAASVIRIFLLLLIFKDVSVPCVSRTPFQMLLSLLDTSIPRAAWGIREPLRPTSWSSNGFASSPRTTECSYFGH